MQWKTAWEKAANRKQKHKYSFVYRMRERQLHGREGVDCLSFFREVK